MESEEMSTACEPKSMILRKAPLKKIVLDRAGFRSHFKFGEITGTLIETKAFVDDDWKEWRAGLKGTLGGSDFPSLVGVGYDSPRITLKRVLGISPQKEINGFLRRAMDHGKAFESWAHKYYTGVVYPGSENVSYHSAVYKLEHSDGATLCVCISPDMLFFSEETLVEIKCPYYGLDSYGSALEFADSWTAKHTCGKANYYAQLMFYSVLLHYCVKNPIDCYTRGDVAVAFVNKEESTMAIAVYGYDIQRPDSFTLFEKLIADLVVACSSPDTYKITKEQRSAITQDMSDSLKPLPDGALFYITEEYFVCEHTGCLFPLEKQCEERSWDEYPEPPWE